MASLFVPRETAEGEGRVAATPESVARLRKEGLEVRVERGAGIAAGHPDAAYEQAGATLADPGEVADAAIVARVAPPSVDEVERLAPGTVLLAFMAPHRNLDAIRRLARRKVTTLAMDLVPRTSRAQTIDALSSQASVAGYRAVIEAAHALDKYFPLSITAAGTIRPARVVVVGAGVAGLQAVATARRLGAVVHVSDVREAAREEVVSLGASFIELPGATDATGEGGYARVVDEDFVARQREILTGHLADAHAVITTAQVPGRDAPQVITRAMVEAMPSGSVVIDLAAADGGNCELTDVTGVVEHDGVRIVPGHDLTSTMAAESSALYARNITAFCGLIVADGAVDLDLDDDVVAGALLTHDGEVTAAPVAQLLHAPRPTDDEED